MQIQLSTMLFYIFLVAVGFQLVYWLFFLLGLIKIKNSSHAPLESVPAVSIIVAARNELDNLKKLIPAILQQDHPQFEIIIVNDRSHDGTDEFLISEEARHDSLKALHVHELPEHISGKKYALTLGIKAAKHKHILLTDADSLPSSSSWASLMAAGFNQGGDILLGFSNYSKLPGLLNYFIRFETLLTGIEYLSAAVNKLPFMGVGRNLAYKKDIFLENKGFFGYHEFNGGDDDIFINKHANSQNTLVISGVQAITISKPKKTWSSFWHQKIRHLQVGKYYTFKSKVVLGIFNLSWILTWIVGIWCLVLGIDALWIIIALFLRTICLYSSFIMATKKLGIAFEIGGLIFLDVIFTIYYIFAGTKALFVKTISWV